MYVSTSSMTLSTISWAEKSDDRLDMNWSENDINFKEENLILKNNVKELQEQLQNAYIRIKELTNTKQLELDFGEWEGYFLGAPLPVGL